MAKSLSSNEKSILSSIFINKIRYFDFASNTNSTCMNNAFIHNFFFFIKDFDYAMKENIYTD